MKLEVTLIGDNAVAPAGTKVVSIFILTLGEFAWKMQFDYFFKVSTLTSSWADILRDF